MSLRSGAEHAGSLDGGRDGGVLWMAGDLLQQQAITARSNLARGDTLPAHEARRVRNVIEAAIGDIFGVPHAAIAQPTRGKAPVARARQTAMYLAHVSCGFSLTDVGYIFERDRTTVAHACAVIEDRRDDPIFDRALELMEWIVPTIIGRDIVHRHHDI